MMFRAAAVALTLFAAHAVPAAEATNPFVFDKSHANITFSINHLGFSTAHGRFDVFDGTATLDLDAPAKSEVEVVIQTASVNTFWDARDVHLRSPDFFNVEAHPTMSFTSTGVEKTGENTASMTGNLTLLGVTKPVTLEVTLNSFKENPINQKMTAGFTAVGTMNRSEFGMTKAVPAVGDEVELRIDMEMQQAQ